MPLSKELQKRIEEKFGRPIKGAADCDSLVTSIEGVTHYHIGVTTVKRMFGLTSDAPKHGDTTMDVIAKYLGYKDMKDMARLLGDASDISMFAAVDELDIENLEPGSLIKIAYSPRRVVVMDYIGDNWFLVNESKNSKLQKGDKLRIFQLAKGIELLATEVVRDGEALGQYHSAKDGGLTLVEII